MSLTQTAYQDSSFRVPNDTWRSFLNVRSENSTATLQIAQVPPRDARTARVPPRLDKTSAARTTPPDLGGPPRRLPPGDYATSTTECESPDLIGLPRPLPQEYWHAAMRLVHLRRPTRRACNVAWGYLLRWRQWVYDQLGAELAAPRTYSNEAGAVEFEWHIGERRVALTLGDPNWEYVYWGSVDGEEFEEEGRIAPREVPALLRRLLKV